MFAVEQVRNESLSLSGLDKGKGLGQRPVYELAEGGLCQESLLVMRVGGLQQVHSLMECYPTMLCAPFLQ